MCAGCALCWRPPLQRQPQRLRHCGINSRWVRPSPSACAFASPYAHATRARDVLISDRCVRSSFSLFLSLSLSFSLSLSRSYTHFVCLGAFSLALAPLMLLLSSTAPACTCDVMPHIKSLWMNGNQNTCCVYCSERPTRACDWRWRMRS